MSLPVAVPEVEVHVEGEGAETIVMVHGWPDTYRLWEAQVQALKGRFRCVRFTLPGFDAASARRAYTLVELIDFLRQLIQRHSPGRKVILMLHDWGCVLGYEFAMRNPQLVSRIVGVDIGDPRSLGRSTTPRDKFLIFAYQCWLAIAWVIGGQLGDWMTRYMARRARCPSDPAFMGSRMNYLYYLVHFGSRESFRGQVQRFRPACPMLFIYGRRKPFMFHATSWLDELRAQPANQVVEFDAGHWVMSAQPERFNQVVGDWLCAMTQIRQSVAADRAAMLEIINDAAQAYRGVIPADRWHEPYMPAEELASEIAAGIEFWVAEEDGHLLGVMGIQDKGEVALVRHAYVSTKLQGKGVGTELLRHVESLTSKPVLIGTWAAATWAVEFYKKNGYTVASPEEKDRLLRKFWSIPARQIETSVVLADRRWMAGMAANP